jgi:hypothetical protein
MDRRNLKHRDPRRATTPARAVVSGFAASVVMLCAFAVAYTVGWLLAQALPAGPEPVGTLRRWLTGLTNNPVLDLAWPSLYGAVAVYLAGGLVWAGLYAYLFEPRLAGPGWRRGCLFALVPWLFSLGVFLPLLGGGFLGLGLGAGPLPIVGNLLLHAVYGATLGEVFGPAGDDVLDGDLRTPGPDDVLAGRRSEIGVAAGLLIGAVAGAGVASLPGGLAPVTSGPPAAALHPLAAVLAAAVLGGALGALVGSLVGLSAGQPHA